MSNQPLFIASWKETQTDFLVSDVNRPKIVFTPGANGSRVHAIALTNMHSSAAGVFFGYATEIALGAGGVSIASVSNASTITRNDGGSYVTDGWKVGQFVLLDDRGASNTANRSFFRITAVTGAVLTVYATMTAETYAGATKLVRWRPFWTINAAANAGNSSGTPAASGLDLSTQQAFMDATGDRYLLLTQPLWAFHNNGAGSNYGLFVNVYGGDY